jgi:hypothetical protein
LLPLSYKCETACRVAAETETWLQTSSVLEELEQLFWLYHSSGDVIPQTSESLWSGHFFPWIESFEELQISSNLAFFGMYKQAMIGLRVSLEMGLLSVYWNLNDDGHEVVGEWLHSKELTPKSFEVWRRLEEHPHFRHFQESFDLKSRIDELNYLHGYVHTRGAKYSNSTGRLTSNMQTFEEEQFLNWFSAFREVVHLIVLLHLIKYPIATVKIDLSRKFGLDIPSFGILRPIEVERIEDAFGDEIMSVLREIYSMDERAQGLISAITEKPDMTEEEIGAQELDWDRSQIEHMGVSAWKKLETSIIERIEDLEQQEARISRMDDLVEWGIKNGFELSPFERHLKTKSS